MAQKKKMPAFSCGGPWSGKVKGNFRSCQSLGRCTPKIFSSRSCQSLVERGSALQGWAKCWAPSVVLLLESGYGYLSPQIIWTRIMLPNKQKLFHFQFVTGMCSVINMSVNIIKHLFNRDELETLPLPMEDMETICWRHLQNTKFYEFLPLMSISFFSW